MFPTKKMNIKYCIAEDLIAAGRKEATIIVSSSSSYGQGGTYNIFITAFTDLIFECLIAFRLDHDFDQSPNNAIDCLSVIFDDINGYFMYNWYSICII